VSRVGYLEKTMALSQRAVAIRAAAAGETAISPQYLAQAMRRTPADTPSSRRCWVSSPPGLSNQAIADRLVLSLHTSTRHRAPA
jgi:DNA-binding NarL/FixJ family response regulator